MKKNSIMNNFDYQVFIKEAFFYFLNLNRLKAKIEKNFKMNQIKNKKKN